MSTSSNATVEEEVKVGSIIPTEDIDFLMFFFGSFSFVLVNLAFTLESLISSFYLFFSFGFLSFVALLYSLLDIDITHLKRAFTALNKKVKEIKKK